MSGNKWQGSNRRAGMPANWWPIRQQVWKRDAGLCQWPGPFGPCNMPGRDVDHRVDPADHSPENLWVLCGAHHDHKTQGEARAARRPRVSRKREPERHPGLIDPG